MTTKKINLNIQGMHCGSCAKMIELELEDKAEKTNIDATTGKATIEFDDDKTSEKEIKNIILKIGYKIK